MYERFWYRMSIVSNKIVFQLKNAPAFFFKLCWDHPIVSALLCSSGLFAVLFPNVLKSLVLLITLLVSTVLFLAALYRVGPQATVSMKEIEKASGENDGPKKVELKKLNVISSEGEPLTADCKKETEKEIAGTVEEQNFRGVFEDKCGIKNEGMSVALEEHGESEVAAKEDPEETISFNEIASISSWEEVAKTLHLALHSEVAAEVEYDEDCQQKPIQNVEINNREISLVGIKEHEPTGDPEEALSICLPSSGSTLDVFIRKIQKGKELVPVEQHKVSSRTSTEEEDEGNDTQPEISGEGRQEQEDDGFDFPLTNFFSVNIKSSWTRFDSSSDSISEASSLGNLGLLFDDLDPLLFTDEDDDPKASIRTREDEKRHMDWTEEDNGYENLFGSIKEYDSDSTSEEENLIEIELPETQILSRSEQELRLLQRGAMEELNLIDLDYSDDKEEKLQDLIDFFAEKERAASSSASAFPEEENLIEIDLLSDAFLLPANAEINQFDSVRSKEKVSSFQNPERKENTFTDLLSELPNHDQSHKTHSWKNVWQSEFDTPFVPSKLLDLKCPSIKEMNMVGLGDEKSKPEKTEAPCGESIYLFDKKEMQQSKVINLLD